MFTRTISIAIAAFTLGVVGVVARSAADVAYREQVRNCVGTVTPANFQDVYMWEYDDTTYFNITYNYDPTYCDSTITFNSIQLTDYANGATYPCTRQQFAANRNTIFSECRVFDRGYMARQARDGGGNDWGVGINYGNRTRGPVANFNDYFTLAAPESAEPPVEETPAPTPSGSFQKKRSSIEQQHKFDCPTGQTYCWTGERQEYACSDTSSDVTACGRCPYAPGADSFGGDCTSIEGADDVQCYKSKCVGSSWTRTEH